MSLFLIALVIVLVGVTLWFINTSVPMDDKIKTLLNIVVVIGLVLWVLSALGIVHLGHIKLI